MPILKGVMSYTRFLVPCEVKPFAVDEIVEKLMLFRFRPLHPRGEDKQTMGFCPYLFEFDDERPITMMDCFFDDKIVLCFRVDSIVLPINLLKAAVKKSLSVYQKDFKKLPDRTVKKEIEQAEAKALRARILPKSQIIESMWCQKSGEMRVFSRSKTLVDGYIDFFKQTFNLHPIKRDFAHEALVNAKSKSLELNAATLSHQPIFLPPMRIDVQ